MKYIIMSKVNHRAQGVQRENNVVFLRNQK